MKNNNTAVSSNVTTKNNPKKSTSKKRQPFSPAVVKDIAFEAHLFCSNPTCCRFTSYSTSAGRARAIAEAAHINAASPSGPRPGKNLSREYLKSKSNGIWLCRNCHSRVDGDPNAYPESILIEWKDKHLEFVKKLVDSEFDQVIFDLYVRSRNYYHGCSFLAFIEGKRVFFDALNVEVPSQVFDSINEIRIRINNALPFMVKDNPSSKVLRKIRYEINRMLTDHPNMGSMVCNGSDPDFVGLCQDLEIFRKNILPEVVEMANDLKYKLCSELMDEYIRLENS